MIYRISYTVYDISHALCRISPTKFHFQIFFLKLRLLDLKRVMFCHELNISNVTIIFIIHRDSNYFRSFSSGKQRIDYNLVILDFEIF